MHADNVLAIDHIAVAVKDLDAAVEWARAVLGCTLVDERDTHGKTSGMKSAVMRLGALTMVLVQGTGKNSHVCEFVEKHGAGVQHVALRVNDMGQAIDSLKARHAQFATPLLRDGGLSQVFLMRDSATGVMLELIQRESEGAFSDANVTRLFESLESQQLY